MEVRQTYLLSKSNEQEKKNENRFSGVFSRMSIPKGERFSRLSGYFKKAISRKFSRSKQAPRYPFLNHRKI